MNSVRPYKQILAFLMEIMEQVSFEPNYKLPSERMLATKFGASRRSIRMAYDKLLEQDLVLKVHGKGYFTTGNSKNRPRAAHLPVQKISFIIPSLRTLFSQEILHGISDFCDEHTMDVSIKLSKENLEKEAQYIHSAFSSDTKGIILFPTDYEIVNHELLQLSANRYPITIIDRYFKNINSSFIATDNGNAMMEAIKFLHSKKHKNLLYITSPSSVATSVEERLNGYFAGMEKHYGKTSKKNVLTVPTYDYQEVYNQVTTYLKANPKPEVLISGGVLTTTSAIIAAVNDLGLFIPKDIKLMVFDNEFSNTEINLIRPYVIQQDAYQIGYQSAATLYNQIYGDLRTKTIRLPAKIIDFTDNEEANKHLFATA